MYRIKLDEIIYIIIIFFAAKLYVLKITDIANNILQKIDKLI